MIYMIIHNHVVIIIVFEGVCSKLTASWPRPYPRSTVCVYSTYCVYRMNSRYSMYSMCSMWPATHISNVTNVFTNIGHQFVQQSGLY